jgi:flavin reductase (DIM6/NTAB) family NADH-FMN oxidoreductase RutF
MGERFGADFRNAMRRLASAVTVISTASHDGHRFGMTATAVTSVSSDPPSLLTCINRAASLHDPLLTRARFCVNILHADHSVIAESFGGARRGEERFAVGDWAADATGIPYLREAQANLFCDADLTTPYATHTIVVGKVTDIVAAGRVAPLLYQDGRYTVGLGEGIDWVVPI